MCLVAGNPISNSQMAFYALGLESTDLLVTDCPDHIKDLGFVCAINCPSNTCKTDAMVVEHVSRLITD